MPSHDKGYDFTDYPPFAVTVDLVIFTIIDTRLHVLCVTRGEKPYKGRLALPGGFVHIDETLEQAARRELAEETGVGDTMGHIEQLQTYGAVKRDPRGRVVSVAWMAFLAHDVLLTAGTDAADAAFLPVDDVLNARLAFDHNTIVVDALERARAKLEYTTLATTFLGEEFTLPELARVYEAFWGASLHFSNFARKVTSTPGFVTSTGHTAAPVGRGKRPVVYRRGHATTLTHPILRPSHEPGRVT